MNSINKHPKVRSLFKKLTESKAELERAAERAYSADYVKFLTNKVEQAEKAYRAKVAEFGAQVQAA